MLWSSSRVRRTMSVPRKVTVPPTTAPGGESSWATANNRVDLPQPDSPTIPRNSPGATAKLTCCTAPTSVVSVAYSTDRSETSSRGSVTPPPLFTALTQRAQRGISDLVEGVVHEREAGTHQSHRSARRESPPGVAGLEGRCLLCVVEHRAPHQLAAVPKSEELKTGGEPDLEDRQGQKRSGQQRGHGRDDLDQDDVQGPFSACACRHEELTIAHRHALRPQLPGLECPAGDREHDYQRADPGRQVRREQDQQRKHREDQEDVGYHRQDPIGEPSEVRGRHADDHRDERG